MANEATIIELLGDEGNVLDFTIYNVEAIPKGTICMLSGAGTRQASKSLNSGPVQVFAGIAATEKEASDGQTRLGLYTQGIFYLTASGDIARGASVGISGANKVTAITEAQSISGAGVGTALTANTDGNKVEVAIGVY